MCVFVLVYCCCIRFHLRQSLQDYWSAVPSFHKSTTDASTRDRAYYSTTVLLVETIVSLFLHAACADAVGSKSRTELLYSETLLLYPINHPGFSIWFACRRGHASVRCVTYSGNT